MTAGNIVAFVTACAGLLTALGTMFGAMVAIRRAREEAAAALLQAQSAADRATVDALTDTITSLQTENERLRACMAELEAKQGANDATIENLRKSIEKLQNENRTLRQRVGELENENHTLRKQREAGSG